MLNMKFGTLLLLLFATVCSVSATKETPKLKSQTGTILLRKSGIVSTRKPGVTAVSTTKTGGTASGSSGPSTAPKPTASAKSTTDSGKTKTAKTLEKQFSQFERVAGRDAVVKEAISKIKEAKRKADVTAAVAELTAEVKKKSKSMSKYQKAAAAVTLFRLSSKTKLSSTAELIREMGPLALSLDIKEIKKMDLVSIRELLKIAAANNHKFDKKTQIQIFSNLVKLTPKKDWTEAMGASLRPLKEGLADHKDLKKLPRDAIIGIFSFYKNLKVDCKKKSLPYIIKVYLASTSFKDFSSVILPRFGNLLGYLSIKQLRSIPANALSTKAQVKKFCSATWCSQQKKLVTAIAMRQANFQDVTKLMCEDQRAFSNCWDGVKVKTFKKINITKDDIDCFNTTILRNGLRNELAKKVRAVTGAIENLGVGEVRKVLEAYGADVSELLALNGSVINDVSDELTKQIKKNVIKDRLAVKIAVKRMLKEQVKDKSFKLAKISSKVVSKMTLSAMSEIPVEKLGFSENDTVTESSSEGEEEEESLGVSLAGIVISKLKAKYGKPHANLAYWRKGIIKAKRFCCGFSENDISQLPDDFLKDFVSESKAYSYKCPAFINALTKRYKKLIDTEANEVLTENDIYLLGKALPGMPLKNLLNFTDNEDVRKQAIGFLATACSVDIYPQWRLRGLSVISLAMMKIISGTAVTSDTIDILGCLMQYVDIKIWKDIPNDVIANRSEALSQYKYANDVRLEIVKKLKQLHAKNGDVANAFAEITSEQFQRYIGLIISVLTAADINKFKTDVLKENAYALAKLEMNSQVAQAINSKVAASSSGGSSRKRRATVTTDLSNMTSTQITEMGTRLYGLSADDIKTIKDDVLKEALDSIGNLQGFTQVQREAWVFTLKRAYGSIASITDTDLKRLKYIILGMTPLDMQSLKLNNLEVISEFSKITGYTTAQRQAMYAEIKKDIPRAHVKDFTGYDLAAAAQFLLAAVHTDISQILAANYKDATRELGDVTGWSADQMTALKTVAISAYGNVNTWSTSVVKDIGAAIGGCTAAELNSIAPATFAVAKAVAIKQIPVNTFKELSINHIKGMTPVQFGAVTSAQKSALSNDKLSAFNTASGINEKIDPSSLVTDEGEKCQTWNGSCSGANSMRKINAGLIGAILFVVSLLYKLML